MTESSSTPDTEPLDPIETTEGHDPNGDPDEWEDPEVRDDHEVPSDDPGDPSDPPTAHVI